MRSVIVLYFIKFQEVSPWRVSAEGFFRKVGECHMQNQPTQTLVRPELKDRGDDGTNDIPRVTPATSEAGKRLGVII